MYALIENDQIKEVRNTLPTTWRTPDRDISNFHQLEAEQLKAFGWHEMEVNDPPYDLETQVKEGPIDTWNGRVAARSYIVRPRTQEELDALQEEKDIRKVRAGTILIGSLLVQLIKKLLQENIISAQDFTPQVRQDFQTLKDAIDRLAK